MIGTPGALGMFDCPDKAIDKTLDKAVDKVQCSWSGRWPVGLMR